MKCVAANQRDANLWRYAVPTLLPLNIIETPLHLQKAQIDIHHDVGMAYRYIPSKLIIIRNKFFFLFIGRKPTMWPANNSLQIMVCSSAMPSNSVWLQIIFCSCVKETVLFSFLRSLLRENGRSLRFPKIFLKKQTRWSNDKTIIELRYRKISWFVSVLQINYYDLLTTDKSRYCAQAHPVIVNYLLLAL